jgi:hypothetical protein
MKDERTYWLELLAESGILNADRLTPLQDEANQLIAIFTTISKKVKKRVYS